MSVAYDITHRVIREKGVLRACDFERELNSHNWLSIYAGLFVKPGAPRLFVRGPKTFATELAAHRHRSGIIGLESALWVAKLLPAEPTPVCLVVHRGVRPSRFSDPPIEYHWSNTEDDGAKDLRIFNIVARVHSVERALLDILRTRPPELWPSIPLERLDLERLARLASQLRARGPLSAWLAAQKGAAPLAPGGP